jgi:uncharacterized protein
MGSFTHWDAYTLAMKAPALEVRHLDVAKMAESGETLAALTPLTDLPRLCEAAAPEAPPTAADTLDWHARGESRQVGGEAQVWLHIEAAARLHLTCQRCLQPAELRLQAQRSFRFVNDEAQAEALDADSEEDILALSPDFDLLALLEDEMLLAITLVPAHEHCPQPLIAPKEPPEEEKPNPFAALAALKGRQG